jgi:hypothetical protein
LLIFGNLGLFFKQMQVFFPGAELLKQDDVTGFVDGEPG